MGLWQETVMKHGTEEEEEAVHEAKRAELLCRLATTPFGWPQRYPLGETQAVHRFTEADSEHTPHLLRYSADHVLKGVDEKAMMGGYAVFLLMNKLQDCILHNLIWDEKERTWYVTNSLTPLASTGYIG
jgi:hypothetical protein